MATGLYSGVSGLAIGVGLNKGVTGLWSGASGLITGWGGGQLIRLNTLNASGVSYNAYAAADSNGNNYPVTNTVLAADGTPYSVL